MRKRAPIIVLITVQLVFALSLTAVKPVQEWLIYNQGETFIFETDRLTAHYNYFNGEFSLSAEIKHDYDTEIAAVGKYGIIKTDENGISRISGIASEKPDNSPYIESFYDWFVINGFWYSGTISPEAFESMEFEFTQDGDGTVSKSNRSITLKAIVYNGKIRHQGIFVDGIPIEEFIK